MAFSRTNFNTLSSGAAGGFRVFAYTSSADAMGTVIADDYFLTAFTSLSAGDLIQVAASDGHGTFRVGVSSSSTVTLSGSIGLCQVLVTVPTASVLTLRATPYELVAAPGAGKLNVFEGAMIQLDYAGTAYTESADNMAIVYTDASGVVVSTAIEATGLLDATADTMVRALPVLDAIVANSASENKALVLDNTGDGEYATGTSPFIITTWYSVLAGV